MKFIVVKQGLPKKRRFVKSMLLRRMLQQSLGNNVLGLKDPNNTYYGTREILFFFHALITEGGSGNFIKEVVFGRYEFNTPDPQTVKNRCEKLSLENMESIVNANLRKFALTLPSFKSVKNLAKIKSRNWRKNSSRRLRQRERGISPPQGRYVSLDFTLKPFYPRNSKFYRENEHEMSQYLTKDRKKHSTVWFLGYHTVYDVEIGSRQILGIHMLKNQPRDCMSGDWKREPLDEVVKYLIDPIRAEIDIAGITGDGAYYNKKALRYLEKNKLDYVIRAPLTPTYKYLIHCANLEQRLADGEGYESKLGNHMIQAKIHTRLVLVKRGQDVIPLVLPRYSTLSPEQALLVYEERFGIETSYREIYRYLPTTSSLSPNYRLAIFAMTSWFFNLMLNYYEVVVIWSKKATSWHTSLLVLKSVLRHLLGEMMLKASL